MRLNTVERRTAKKHRITSRLRLPFFVKSLGNARSKKSQSRRSCASCRCKRRSEIGPRKRKPLASCFIAYFPRWYTERENLSEPRSQDQAQDENRGRVRFLSAKEEQALRKEIAKSYPQHLPAFEISIHTGMRAGEQFRIRWSDIDFDRRILTIPRTKNGDTRHIPLNQKALSAFRQLRKDGPGTEWVFVNSEGNQLRNQRDWFDRVLENTKLPNYTWHCNRHTFASRLVMAGVDLRTVGELLGHRTFQMTLRYAHLAADHKQSAVDRLCDPAPVRPGRMARKRLR